MTATLFFHHQSLEVIRQSIKLTSENVNVFSHRPPLKRNDQLTDKCFFSEFSFLFVLCNALPSSIII